MNESLCDKIVLIMLVAFVWGVSCANCEPASDPIEGKWTGMAGFPQDRVQVGFEFKRNAQQEMKAYLYEPVVNFYGLELPGVLKKEEGKYTLAEYALSVTLQDSKLEGTYLPLNAPISLERTDTLPQEVPVPDFPKAPDTKWRVKLGAAIYAAAVVRGGVVYVGTSGGMFYAVSLQDGSFVWAFPAGHMIVGEALVTDEHVYFVCDNGYLFKLDRLKGGEVWRYDLGDARASRILVHQVVTNSGDFDFDHMAPRPLLVDGVIYVGSGDGSFHAIDAATGKNIWKFQGQGKIRTDASTDGLRVFFGTYDNIMYGVDRKTGKEVWHRDIHAQVTTSPVIVADKLIIGNRGGVLAALNPVTGETIWRMLFWGSSVESTATPGEGSLFYIGSSDMRRVSLIDSKDGRVLWRTDVFGWAWPRPTLTEKRLYMSASSMTPYEMRHLGSLNALDRTTGKILWRWPMPEWPGSLINGFVASPVVESSTLVVGGLDGTLYAFPAE